MTPFVCFFFILKSLFFHPDSFLASICCSQHHSGDELFFDISPQFKVWMRLSEFSVCRFVITCMSKLRRNTAVFTCWF